MSIPELYHFLEGQTAFMTRALLSTSNQMQRDVWSPDQLATHVHQELLSPKLKQETREKIDAYFDLLKNNEADWMALQPKLDYISHKVEGTSVSNTFL